MNEKKFTPLVFLASLGAGGISVIPFAFLQYTQHTGKGLISYAQLGHGALPLGSEILLRSLEGVMILFTLLHFGLTFTFLRGLIRWARSSEYAPFMRNPLTNAGILAPFISIAMSMNVMIGPVRFFVPWMAANLQTMMLPALLVWSLIWIALMRMEIRLLKTTFEQDFDVNQINFGWLLHPFALGMVTVTGTGIAAMSQTPAVAHTAAFMSLVSGTMGFFLLSVKLTAVFKSHFAATGLPAKQFMPSLLIVVPNVTLYAISAFRMGHYLEHQFGMHLPGYSFAVITLAFAFETWYMAFGLSLMRDYFRRHFIRREFYVTQWGLICPFVAYAVLAAFFFKLFVPNPVTYVASLAAMTAAIGFYFVLLRRHLTCAQLIRTDREHDCASGLRLKPVVVPE